MGAKVRGFTIDHLRSIVRLESGHARGPVKEFSYRPRYNHRGTAHLHKPEAGEVDAKHDIAKSSCKTLRRIVLLGQRTGEMTRSGEDKNRNCGEALVA